MLSVVRVPWTSTYSDCIDFSVGEGPHSTVSNSVHSPSVLPRGFESSPFFVFVYRFGLCRMFVLFQEQKICRHGKWGSPGEFCFLFTINSCLFNCTIYFSIFSLWPCVYNCMILWAWSTHARSKVIDLKRAHVYIVPVNTVGWRYKRGCTRGPYVSVYTLYMTIA